MVPKQFENRAAWLSARGSEFRVDKAPYPGLEVDDHNIIIKVAAVAINPIDWKVQESGQYVRQWPTILGHDAAGEVVQVGARVTTVKPSDRVLVHTLPLASGRPQEGAFQRYSVAPGVLSAQIPDAMTFEEACVLPLSISTAAAGLFDKKLLGLPLPLAPNAHKPRQSSSGTILIWGGSSSVGSSAIQLARASGLRVLTTASPANLAAVLLTGLDEQDIFDYKDSQITDRLVQALQGENLIGAFDCIGLPATTHACAAILSSCNVGCTSKLVSVNVVPDDLQGDVDATKGEPEELETLHTTTPRETYILTLIIITPSLPTCHQGQRSRTSYLW